MNVSYYEATITRIRYELFSGERARERRTKDTYSVTAEMLSSRSSHRGVISQDTHGQTARKHKNEEDEEIKVLFFCRELHQHLYFTA